MGYKLKEVRPGVFELVEIPDVELEKERKAEQQQQLQQQQQQQQEQASADVGAAGEKTEQATVAIETKSVKPKKVREVPENPEEKLLPKEVRIRRRESAVKRLMRDLDEISKNPLPTVNAAPLEENLFEWHANILGTSDSVYGGLIFHLVMNFPRNYPNSPPKVKLCNTIQHPNVFGEWICLDMLEGAGWNNEEEKSKVFTGWTTAYSVQSILVQLQNFLMANAVNDVVTLEYNYNQAFNNINKYKCKAKGCYHSPKDHVIWPLIAKDVIYQVEEEKRDWLKSFKMDAEEIHEKQVKNRWDAFLLKWKLYDQQHRASEREELKWEKAAKKKPKVYIARNAKGEREVGSTFFGVLRKYEPPAQLVEAKKAGDEEDDEPASKSKDKGGKKEEADKAKEDAEKQAKGKKEQPKFVLPKVFKTSDKRLPDIKNTNVEFRLAAGKMSRRFNSSFDISVYRTASGLMYKIEFDDKSFGSSTLSLWDQVYPVSNVEDAEDPVVQARRASGIPMKYQTESATGRKPLLLPKIRDQIQFVLYSKDLIISPGGDAAPAPLSVEMKMDYDLEEYYAKGSKWIMTCPDQKRPGNVFAIVLLTNNFNLTYAMSMMYFVKMSDKDWAGVRSSSAQIVKVSDDKKEVKPQPSPVAAPTKETKAQPAAAPKVDKKGAKGQASSAATETPTKPEAPSSQPEEAEAEAAAPTAVAAPAPRGRGRGIPMRRVIISGNSRGGARNVGGRGATTADKAEVSTTTSAGRGGKVDPAAAKPAVYVPPVSNPVVISSNFGNSPSPPVAKKNDRNNRNRSAKGKEKVDAPSAKPPVVAEPSPAAVSSPTATAPAETKQPAAAQSENKNEKKGKGQQQAAPKEKEKYRISWRDLPSEVKLHIFSYLGRNTLLDASKVSQEFEELALDSSFWVRQELFCYHSKVDFTEDTLGIGMNIHYYPASRRLERADAYLDLISYSSFMNDHVKRSAWKEPMTHWLPLYISWQHAKKAMPLAKRIMSEIVDPEGSSNNFQPLYAVDLLTRLMNTMVVTLMNQDCWASEKAIEGYFAFHHMLLAFAEEYPEIVEWANDRIERFINSEEGRIKKAVPDLGQFIPLLGITDKYHWSDVAQPLILEVFDRNAKWVLKQFPELGNLRNEWSKDVDRYRILSTFTATQVSQRLVMFHLFFLNKIAKPGKRSVSEVKSMYDDYYGRPTQKMKYMLQVATKEIQTIDNWIEFFGKIDMPLPTPQRMTEWLRKSVLNSARKRYHNKNDYADQKRGKTKKKKEEADELMEAAEQFD